MGKTTAIKILQLGLTREEREALDAIAAEENVSLGAVVRDVLAEKYPDSFGKVHRPRSGYGGGHLHET